MKLIHTNMPIGMTILLVLLTILLSFILVPFLLIVVFCWFVRLILSGFSPLNHYRSGKDCRLSPVFNGMSEQQQNQPGSTGSSAANDETIDCEVLSARTFDENGQEIR